MQQLRLFEPADKNKIIIDMFQAYFDARKNKRNTINALAFEKHFEANIFALYGKNASIDQPSPAQPDHLN